MNVVDWLAVAFLVFVFVACYYTPHSLQKRLTAPLDHWLGPWMTQLFPDTTKEPWLLEPIAADGLPQNQRRFFETHTPGFTIRGFTLLGDFVIRRDRTPSCARFFISRDRMMIGEVASYLGMQTVGCMSVLLDGFYLESSNVSLSQFPPSGHGLQFSVVKSDDACDVIDHHAACLAETAAARGFQPAVLESSELSAVMSYGRELSLRSLHQQGLLEELPAFLRSRPST